MYNIYIYVYLFLYHPKISMSPENGPCEKELSSESIFRFFCVRQRGIYINMSIHISVEVPILEVSPFTPEASIVCSSYSMPGSIVKLQPMLPGIVKWMCLEHISQLGAS